MITYAPLWKTLKTKGVSQYALIKKYGMSTGTLDSLRQNRSITMNSLNDLCTILDCKVEEVIEYVPDKK